MDSFVLRWRALLWGRVWCTVGVLTLAWSIGAGLAVRAVTPVHADGSFDCTPSAMHPPLMASSDLLELAAKAAIAAPLGLYVSGLLFGLAALAVVVLPAALLPQGTARRILAAPVVGLLAVAIVWAAWTGQLWWIARTGLLPTLACSN